MNWQDLFLSARGRLDRKGFWTGAAILIVVGLVAGVLPLVGPLASLLLLYPWTCLTIKRLHDFGRSGRLALIPMAPMLLVSALSALGALALVVPGGLLFLAGWAWLTMALSGLAALVALGFLVWVGVTPSHEGVNRYGAPADALPLPI